HDHRHLPGLRLAPLYTFPRSACGSGRTRHHQKRQGHGGTLPLRRHAAGPGQTKKEKVIVRRIGCGLTDHGESDEACVTDWLHPTIRLTPASAYPLPLIMKESRHPHPHIDPRQPRHASTPGTNPPVFAWKPPTAERELLISGTHPPVYEKVAVSIAD